MKNLQYKLLKEKINSIELTELLPEWDKYCTKKEAIKEVDILLKSAYHDVYELKKFDKPDKNMVYTSNPVLERVIATRFKRENPIKI